MFGMLIWMCFLLVKWFLYCLQCRFELNGWKMLLNMPCWHFNRAIKWKMCSLQRSLQNLCYSSKRLYKLLSWLNFKQWKMPHKLLNWNLSCEWTVYAMRLFVCYVHGICKNVYFMY